MHFTQQPQQTCHPTVVSTTLRWGHNKDVLKKGRSFIRTIAAVGSTTLRLLGEREVPPDAEHRALEVLLRESIGRLRPRRAGLRKPRLYEVWGMNITPNCTLGTPGVPAGQQVPRLGARPPSLGETLANFFQDPRRKVPEVVQFIVKIIGKVARKKTAEVCKHHNSPYKIFHPPFTAETRIFQQPQF